MANEKDKIEEKIETFDDVKINKEDITSESVLQDNLINPGINKLVTVAVLGAGILLIVAASLFAAYVIKTDNRVPKKKIIDSLDGRGTSIAFSVDDADAEIEILNISADLRERVGSLGIDLTDAEIDVIDCTGDYALIQYSKYDSSVLYEIYIRATGKEDVVDLGTFKAADIVEYLNSNNKDPLSHHSTYKGSELEDVLASYSENSTESAEETEETENSSSESVEEPEETEETEDSTHIVSEALCKLYDQGYVYVLAYENKEKAEEAGFNKEVNALEYANNIANTVLYSKKVKEVGKANATSNLEIALDGIDNKLYPSKLPFMHGMAGVVYSNDDKVLRIYDNEQYIPVLYITHVNNSYINSISEKLVPYENYKNVFIDIGFRNDADWGYGGFAVQTKSCLYYFKLANEVSDKETAMQDVISWLGVKDTDDKIETVLNPIMTMDDMLDEHLEAVAGEVINNRTGKTVYIFSDDDLLNWNYVLETLTYESKIIDDKPSMEYNIELRDKYGSLMYNLSVSDDFKLYLVDDEENHTINEITSSYFDTVLKNIKDSAEE